jgi:putative membrane protein
MKNKILTLLVATALAACNNSPGDAVKQAENTNEAKVDSSDLNNANAEQAKNDADFLVFAADVGAFEIEAANIAAKNSQNARVKEFAAMMVKDHTMLGESVKTLAGKKNVTLPTALSNDMQTERNKLDSLKGRNFDKEYCDANVKGHEQAVTEFQKVASGTGSYSAEVTQMANTALPILKEHKQHADMLQSSIEKKK